MQTQRRLIESKVDWITATMIVRNADSSDCIERSIDLADKLLTGERQKGNDLKPWRFSGFEGMSSGQVAVGRSMAGLIYRLSGDAAAAHWPEVVDAATNITRLDCAATFEDLGTWSDYSLTHLHEARDYQREHNPRLKVTRIDGGKHGHTLNVGSRSSDAYGRIYDKGAESKRADYDNCWRYEVEFKRDMAKSVAQLLRSEPLDQVQAARVSVQWFRAKGVNADPVLTEVALPCRFPAATDDSKRLHWLRTQVAGSVKVLLESGYRDEVLKALGLC